MLKTRVSTTRILLNRIFGNILILGEHYVFDFEYWMTKLDFFI